MQPPVAGPGPGFIRTTANFILVLVIALLFPSVHLQESTAVGSYGEGVSPNVTCNFEVKCDWTWNETSDGFQIITGQEISSFLKSQLHIRGPIVDANNQSQGHFLFLKVPPNSTSRLYVSSPLYNSTLENCRLEVMLHMANISLVVLNEMYYNKTHSLVTTNKIITATENKWKLYGITIGKLQQSTRIVLEVANASQETHVAIDNLNLVNCFPKNRLLGTEDCTKKHFYCQNGICLAQAQVCDIVKDCPNGEDESEEQGCNKVPKNARCDFETDLCGWRVVGQSTYQRASVISVEKPAPSFDHTFGNKSLGSFLWVVLQGALGSTTFIKSEIFNPPPKYHSNEHSPYTNSCEFRLYYYQVQKSSIAVYVEQYGKKGVTIRSSQLFFTFSHKGDTWVHAVIGIPHVTYRYRVILEFRQGFKGKSALALDDVTLSPECFGLRVPPNETEGYDYETAGLIVDDDEPIEIVRDFVNQTYYELTSCGVEGMVGPKPENCSLAYNKTSTNVTVLQEPPYAGVQRWTVPKSGIYTIIAYGASGGLGPDGQGVSLAAVARTVVSLEKGEFLYALVGQRGSSVCRSKSDSGNNSPCERALSFTGNSTANVTGVTRLSQLGFKSNGGGGGGGTFVFTMQGKLRNATLLVVAGGAGGYGASGANNNGDHQGGRGVDASRGARAGTQYGNNSAGSGGGWLESNRTDIGGVSVLQGGHGGQACNGSGDGGFGAGGGGCAAGGGGGGYSGGDAWAESNRNGEGGYSYLGKGTLQSIKPGEYVGSGRVVIIPAIQGCGCEYLCVALNARRSLKECICPEGTVLEDRKHCVTYLERKGTFIAISVGLSVVILLTCAFVAHYTYTKYQRNKEHSLARKHLSGADVQLNSLRNTFMSGINPNYQYLGSTYTLKDLTTIPRERLRLVKALGQGAFGEVYQGFYKHRANDTVEMPVAVKTLPELSTSQAETDFLLEALIMSKFNHPNIVHLIGVCFDRHPRYIILELLAGGDLKTFLRESRPTTDKSTGLTMRDLISCCIDVAKGCRYLEENRFVHRDIAARNCLLTSKGPGRVVKIADFGMAREVYMADYYRKGGKAMLPIKWMPPEAFLDGLFTSKTDVWSYGVLLWEIMSLGFMPYTGCANVDVMNLVARGGRLEPPSHCPAAVYGVMTACWRSMPEERPTFATILERLSYCIEDPSVINAALPVFQRPSSGENDCTVGRPPEREDSDALPGSSAGDADAESNKDYLVPRKKDDMQDDEQSSSKYRLLQGDAPSRPHRPPPGPPAPAPSGVAPAVGDNWIPGTTTTRSQSEQPLLQRDSSSSSQGSLHGIDKSHNNNNNNMTQELPSCSAPTRNGPLPKDSASAATSPTDRINDPSRNAVTLDPSLLGKPGYMNVKVLPDNSTAPHSKMTTC